jgi:folate-dependent phosphoribosylglycinamide formyltransferase PurN
LSQAIPQPGASSQRKVRIAYVTSPRELEGEGVGYDARIAPTLGFLLQRIAQRAPGLENAEIAAVMVDDDGTERRERVPGSGAGTTPSETFSYLRQSCEQHGMIFHLEPSRGWRGIPRSRSEEKHNAKMEFEGRILSFMRENDIDVIFSDSYVVLFNSAMLDEKTGFRGLIINVHPALATEVPGVFPNFDALARARHFTDDPAERQGIISAIEAGDAIVAIRRGKYDESIQRICRKQGVEIEQDGAYNYVPVKESNIGYAFTGATVHEVDELIDHGPTVTMLRSTPISVSDSVHELRIRNYATKNEAAAHGLGAFITRESTAQLITANRIMNRAFQGERALAVTLRAPAARAVAQPMGRMRMQQ